MQQDPETDAIAPEPGDVSSSKQTDEREVNYDLDGPAKTLMDACVQDASNNTARLDRDRQDWLNLLFDRGGPDNQYVIWDAGTNRWVTRGTDPKKGGLPEWMPRPVTNLFANKLDGIVSLLNQSDPAQVWKPNTDDDADLATAEVCGNAVPVLRDEIDYEQIRTDVNRQIVLTDKVAVILWYDNDEKHGTADVRALQCPACAQDPQAEESMFLPMDLPEDAPDTCPNCGSPLEDAVDPRTNQPIGVSYPIGRMSASFHPSFEFSLPRSARSHRADKNPWILFHTRTAWQDAIKEFPDLKEKLKDKTGWQSSSLQRQYADAAKGLSSPRSSSRNGAGSGSDDGPVIYRLYHDPIDDGETYFPDGLYAISVNGQVLKAEPLPFAQQMPNGDRRAFKNVITRTFRPTPASAFGKPPADDLVSLQYTRNLLEALLMGILLHNGSPRTYLPLSVTLEKPITGTPGEVIPFRSTVAGEVPVTAPGVNPPDGLYKWIEQIDAKFDEVSKLNAVLQGERPSGDPTLGEIEILKERGESAFSEPLLESIRFERDLSRMLLWIARDTVWTDRLRQVQGENKAWEITQFTASDLSGNVDVEIDAATAWPKSAAMEKKTLGELIQMGVFQLLKTDPELATKILEKYGATDFLPSLDVDRKQIMRELDAWKAAHDPAEITPPNPVKQNVAFHLIYKTAFLKTEEFELLEKDNAPLAQAILAHVQQLQQLMSAASGPKAEPPKTSFSVKADLTDPDTRKLFEQVNGLPPTAAPPPPQGDGAPNGQALDHAISSGALQPAGAGGTTVDSAVAAGALVPAGAASAHAQAHGPSIDDLTKEGVLTPAGGGTPAEGRPAV